MKQKQCDQYMTEPSLTGKRFVGVCCHLVVKEITASEFNPDYSVASNTAAEF